MSTTFVQLPNKRRPVAQPEPVALVVADRPQPVTREWSISFPNGTGAAVFEPLAESIPEPIGATSVEESPTQAVPDPIPEPQPTVTPTLLVTGSASQLERFLAVARANGFS